MRDNHLSASSLVVKCNANIGEAYWQTTDAAIQVIGKPSYKLHSRLNSSSGNFEYIMLLRAGVIFLVCLHFLVFFFYVAFISEATFF